jgi:Raf kinase inhibitor-like YbhB/YbcL family protein
MQSREIRQMLEQVPAWLGKALRNVRAGHGGLTIAKLGGAELLHKGGFRLMSAAFVDGEALDPMFTADEEDACAPPLEWTAPPPGTRALALIVEDPDAPGPEPLVHWLGWGMEPRAGKLFEGEDPPVMGLNSYQKTEWLAPDPPAGHGRHDYVFQLFALDVPLELAAGSGRGALLDEAEGHVLAAAVLTGSYERR